jgi:ATPase subunit of ABC transporter with duplicated ATPase domains
MDLQQREEFHGGAVFWSPRKLREARARETVKRTEAEQLPLQKTHDRELKAAATLYKKKQAEAAKVERQRAKEERDQAKKARAEELAAARALKKHQHEAVTLQKSYDTPNKATPKASHSAAKSPTKRRCVVSARSQPEAALEPPPPPPQTTRTRSIRRPKKYSE